VASSIPESDSPLQALKTKLANSRFSKAPAGASRRPSDANVLSRTVQSMSGMASAIAHVLPVPTLRSLTTHTFPEDQFNAPISRLARMDISVTTADGSLYDTSRVYLVLDVDRADTMQNS